MCCYSHCQSIALFHGKLHNDQGVWWTKKKARVSITTNAMHYYRARVRLAQEGSGERLDDLYVCALVTIDFMYEFYAKRALFVEHQIEDREHLTEEEVELRKLFETLTGSQLNVTVPVGLKPGDSFNVNRRNDHRAPRLRGGRFSSIGGVQQAAGGPQKLKNIGSSVEDARARAEKRERITAAKAKLAAARRKITLARRIRPPTERAFANPRAPFSRGVTSLRPPLPCSRRTPLFFKTWSAETASKPSSHRLVSGKTPSQPFVGTPAHDGEAPRGACRPCSHCARPSPVPTTPLAAEIQCPYVTMSSSRVCALQ